jgi:hypothetical protein
MNKILISFFIFLIALYSQGSRKSSLREALEKGDSKYFEKVSLADLQSDNKSESEVKTLIAKFELNGIPALVGAFKNPDVEVRKLIYKELTFTSVYKDLRNSRPAQLLQDKDWKPYLDKMRENIYSVEEEGEAKELLDELIYIYGFSLKEAIRNKDAKAVAAMSPDFFKKSNEEDPKGVINRFKRHAVKTLVKAATQPKIHPDTRKQIIEALKFSSLGGPAKIMLKKKARVNRAEALFKLADNEKNEELKKDIIAVAESYYFLDDESSSDKIEVIEPENSTKSKDKK